jgi:hypothetical protein
VNKHTANPATTPSTGIFAALRGLFSAKGTGAFSVRRPGRTFHPLSRLKCCVPALLCAVVGALAFTAAPALAAAPEKPEVLPPTEVKAETATLQGTLSPHISGEVGSTYEFVYKAGAVCTGGSATTPVTSIMGLEAEPVSEPVTLLTPGTEYAVCLAVQNAANTEEVTSLPVTFKTAIPLETPVNTKVKAGSITTTTAEVEGELNPGKERKAEPGTYEFIYKVSALSAAPTAECEESRAPEPAATASGASPEAVGPLKLEHLQPNAKYTFCLRVHNEDGEEATGAPVTFNTPPAPPAVESESSSHVPPSAGNPHPSAAREVRLEGVVNPNNEATECHFQYGTEALLETGVTTTLCEPGSFPASFGGQAVALNVGGLEANKTYYYRIVAKSAAGETTGTEIEPIKSFVTERLPETPEKTAATQVFGTTATLSGELRPGGGEFTEEPGHYEFLYRASATECSGAGQKAAPVPAGVAAGNPQEHVSVNLTGLQPATEYAFCLLVRNEAGEVSLPSAPVMFTTLSQSEPVISGTSATEVTATAAKLNAQVNPGGAETTYHFEYDTSPYTTSAPHGQSTPESPSIGADNSVHPAAAAIQGLQPGTTYHYRLVATNPKSPPGGTDGPDQAFTTETTGGEFALPDGRGYELVSPPQKDGAEVLGIGGGGVNPPGGDATEASEDGTSVTYITSAPVGANPPGNTLSTQMLSTHGAGGWSSLDIATPHKHTVDEAGLGVGEEYRRFSPDLSHALLVPVYLALEPPLAPEIHQEVGRETEIYLRDNATNTFRAVLTSEPLPEVNFEGATPDLSHVVFGGPIALGTSRGGLVGLDPNYPNAEGLYEWAKGETRLVSVLPNEKPASGFTLLGSTSIPPPPDVSATRHAISDDGTRVVWSGEGSLFTRNMTTRETLQVDAKQSGGGVAGGGAFKVASRDGSRVFFTDGNALVTGAHQSEPTEVKSHKGDLYMFEPARPEGERLTDLTLGATRAVNVLEANEAGTAIYVRTPGVLTSAPNSEGESATPCTEGSCNLYLLRESSAGGGAWSVTFVAGGAEESPSDGYGGLIAAEPLQRQAARVSPSGRYLAFMSRRSLTGYDNRDAISGEPDEEVYSYDAETNRLVCASCDPTGARPVGQYDPEEPPAIALDPLGTWKGRWVAAVIPGWTEDGWVGSTGHQPRYLNDSGRLFFTSSDALVPRDVNGRADVYEYDPVGVGGCQPPSYGQGAGVVFNSALGGCVGLISAGTGNTDSAFFDASASGNDVFFTTQEGLVSQDKDGTADMYDARVCAQTEPCPSSLAVSPACTTTDSCRVAPSPQPGVFGAPSSATFAGAGNVGGRESNPPVKPKTAAQVRAQKLAKALKACRTKHNRHKRGTCERQARKRYGPAGAKRASHTAATRKGGK